MNPVIQKTDSVNLMNVNPKYTIMLTNACALKEMRRLTSLLFSIRITLSEY